MYLFGLPGILAMKRRRSHAFQQNCLKWFLQALKSLGKGVGITLQCCEADLCEAGRMQLLDPEANLCGAGRMQLLDPLPWTVLLMEAVAAALQLCCVWRLWLGQWALHSNWACCWHKLQ